MCIDPEKFYKMEERLENHIEENRKDMVTLKQSSRHIPVIVDDISEIKHILVQNTVNVSDLLSQQRAAKWVVKALMIVVSGIGFVGGLAWEYFSNHHD